MPNSSISEFIEGLGIIIVCIESLGVIGSLIDGRHNFKLHCDCMAGSQGRALGIAKQRFFALAR